MRSDKYLQERARKLRMMKSASNSLSHQVRSITKLYKTISEMVSMRVQKVHAFVDKTTGEVYKPVSWQAFVNTLDLI